MQKDWLSVIQKSRYGGNANQPSKDIQPRRGERHTLRIESDRVANEAAKWQRHDASTGTSSVKQWSGGKLLGNGQAAGNANSNGPPGQDLADDEPAAENDGQDVQNALQSGDFSQLAADLQKLLGDRLEDRADREKLQAVAAELAAEVERLLGGRSGSNSD